MQLAYKHRTSAVLICSEHCQTVTRTVYSSRFIPIDPDSFLFIPIHSNSSRFTTIHPDDLESSGRLIDNGQPFWGHCLWHTATSRWNSPTVVTHRGRRTTLSTVSVCRVDQLHAFSVLMYWLCHVSQIKQQSSLSPNWSIVWFSVFTNLSILWIVLWEY